MLVQLAVKQRIVALDCGAKFGEFKGGRDVDGNPLTTLSVMELIGIGFGIGKAKLVTVNTCPPVAPAPEGVT